MLSSEARRVVVVVLAFAAGATLAYVPLSSKPLPLRGTSSYPAWVFLIAITCGLCPIVWSHGSCALASLPPRRSPILEAFGYAVCVVALSAAFVAVNAAFFSHVRPVPLPYAGVRFDVVYLAGILAVAPGSIAMYRVGGAALSDARVADLVAWRAILQSQLTAIGALVVLGTLATSAMRNAVLGVGTAHARDFPAGYVLGLGGGLTMVLALVYLLPSERLRRRAQAVVDEEFPIPDRFDGDWQQQLQRRRDLAAALRTDVTSGDSIKNALIIGRPLDTTALALLIPAR